MQFRVPQFIDMEDKIIGPFTLKQFGYMLGAAGCAFLVWTFIPIKFLAIILAVPPVALFLSLAFLKINDRPFGLVLESAFSYFTSSKVYTWKHPSERIEKGPVSVANTVTTAAKEVTINKVSSGKLHDIALGLDVFDKESERTTSL